MIEISLFVKISEQVVAPYGKLSNWRLGLPFKIGFCEVLTNKTTFTHSVYFLSLDLKYDINQAYFNQLDGNQPDL